MLFYCKKMIGIYKITNLADNKIYVGQSIDIEKRWKTHIRELNKGIHHNIKLQNAWNKYGENCFLFEILEECSEHELNSKESFWIKELDSYNRGYNLDLGGNGIRGYKHTSEELAKMTQIQHPKAVVQLDNNFNVIATYESCSQAAKKLNLSARGIKAVCEHVNHQKTIGGYYWAYKDDFYNSNFDYKYYEKHNRFKREILQFDLNMNYIKTWDSMTDIEKNNICSSGEVSSVCNGKRLTAHNFVWRFKDTYTEDQYNQDKSFNFHVIKVPKTFPNKKKIKQLNLNNTVVKIYESIADAVRQTGIGKANIQAVLSHRHKTAGGYKWEYYNKN